MAAAIHHPSTSSAAAFCSPLEPLLYSRPSNLKNLSKPEISSFLSPSGPNKKSQNLRLSPKFPPSPSISLPFPPPLGPLSTSKPLSSSRLPNNGYSDLLHLSVRYSDVELARAAHASILKLVGEEDTYLFNALIVAYLKLGQLDCALSVFKTLWRPDVVSYTAMISGFAKSNKENEAIELFLEMRVSGIEPNEYSFVALLTACIRLMDLELSRQVHALIIKLGFLDFTYVVNALMGLYSKCTCLDFVIALFNDMPQRDIASWNTVISSLVKGSMYHEAFESFRDMLRIDGLRVDYFTISSLLTASAGCFGLREGQELHAHAIKIGYESNLSVNNALIGFYTKCGRVEDVIDLFERMPDKDVFTWTEMITAYMEFGLVDLAVETFDRMPERNCVSYNAILAGYCQNNEALSALSLFCELVEEGVELNDFTLTTAANACATMMQKETSEQIHGFVLKFGFGRNECVEAALLDMCTRCGRISDAEKIFLRWPCSWDRSIVLTSMVCGYARNRQLDEAISLFCLGQSEELLVLDEVAATTIISVCSMLGFSKFGEQIHCCSIKGGYFPDIKMGNATISMYSKCGKMKDAIKVFDGMLMHDIVSWNSLLAGHVLHRQGDEALAVWMKMEELGVQPDSVTFLFVISAYRYTSSNLVDNCRGLFFSMESTYQIEPTPEHYAHFVSVLGYWGLLEEAEETINNVFLVSKGAVWRALLESCRMHLNATIGKRVIKEILSIEPEDPSAFILKSNLFSASGRWHCSEIVREQMREKGFRKFPGRSWIIYNNKVHSFFARDNSHPQSKDIYRALEILILECLKAGYVPDTSFVLHEAEEHQKKDFLFQHSAKLAITYGLLMTRPGKSVRIMKNILLCGDCHAFSKIVSVVTQREIYIRDTSGFHCFSSGKCSCKDHW